MINKQTINQIKGELEKGNKYFIHQNMLNKRVLGQLKKVEGFKMEPANEYGHMVLSAKRNQ